MVAITHKYFFAVTHMLNVRAELRLQIGDVHGTHDRQIVSNMTMLVTLLLSNPLQSLG